MANKQYIIDIIGDISNLQAAVSKAEGLLKGLQNTDWKITPQLDISKIQSQLNSLTSKKKTVDIDFNVNGGKKAQKVVKALDPGKRTKALEEENARLQDNIDLNGQRVKAQTKYTDANGDLVKTQTKTVEQVKDANDRLQEQINRTYTTKYDQKDDSAYTSMIENRADKTVESLKKQMQIMNQVNDQRVKLTRQSNPLTDTDKYTSNITSKANEIQQSLSKIGDLSTDKAQEQIKSLTQQLADLAQQASKAQNQIADSTNLSKMQSRISKFVEENGKMGSTYAQQFKDLQGELTQGITNEQLDDITSRFNKMQTEIFNKGLTGKGFGQTIKERITSRAADFVSQYFGFQDIIRYTQEIAQNVINVDSALTELRKVSDASTSRLNKSFKTSAETAQELGSSITDVINSTASWSRLGYSVDDAEKLARTSTLFQTVGDNMTSESASQALISTLKAYNLSADQSEQAVDKYNQVNLTVSSPLLLKCK